MRKIKKSNIKEGLGLSEFKKEMASHVKVPRSFSSKALVGGGGKVPKMSLFYRSE